MKKIEIKPQEKEKKDKRIEKMKNFFDMKLKVNKSDFADNIGISRQHINWLLRTNGTDEFRMSDSLWQKIDKGIKDYAKELQKLNR